jgi:hypothetical protein
LAAMIGAPLQFASSEQSPQSPTTNLNKRCCNRRLRDELHVVLRYPRFNIGLPNALTTRDGC